MILETPADELFDIKASNIKLPERARIEPSLPCELCKEPVMKTKLESIDGKTICRGCIENNI